ncbi:MAG: glycosyl hydrolase [Verrucomicrobia bacterium]|nr:glycosyl hydrolase [Verrucomicrobiota bacterium]
MMKMTALKLVVVLTLSAAAWLPAADPVSLDQNFRNVPDAGRPWAYWWWVNGNVDEKTITRDLEAMKHAGIGGLLMFDARGYHDDHIGSVPVKMEFMSAEWRQMLKFAIEKAGKLGLEVSVNLSSCAGALKGPWEVGDDAPKKLVWIATEIKGPKFSFELKKPEGKRFWDVGVIGVRHDDAPAKLSDQWQTVTPKPGSQPVVTEVVDLTPKVDKQGKLTIDVPKGRWTLLRFGYMTMEGHEYDVDVLDPKAVEGHFNRMGKVILEDAGPLAGKTLTHFYSVSWEGAAPTWTPALEREFVNRRGYPLRTWLPALAGFTIKKTDETERFLRDYYKTLGECFRDNFYGKMQALCAKADLKWHSESGGPWDRKLAAFAEADQLTFLGRNDMPQGEFWFTGPGPSKRSHDMNRPQAMAAHIYGKRLAASEAFTHMVQHWSAYPAVLKPFGDTAFCDGVNQFIWHTFTASPAEFGKPGIEYFAGTHLNPNVTWFPQARAFLDYLARCQFMLRQGNPVVDVCVYIGDKPYQHWGRGTNWSERATLQLPRGFNYDLLSTEVLVDRVYPAGGGGFVCAPGMTNRMMVVDLDDETILPAALRKIANLRGSVSMVLGARKPQRSPSLANYPAVDKNIQSTADALWAKPSSFAEAMDARRLLPDFEGPFDWTHRRDGNTDIYFVAGKGTAECTFRVNDKKPELWDAVTGKMTAATTWRFTYDERTAVTLTLPENGSVFVVFRTADLPRQSAPPPPPVEMALNGSWRVRFEPGRGAPASAEFEQLIAWDKHPNDDIKFFSGTATYRKAFELTAEQAKRPIRLRLGEVKCIAEVRVNGQDLGVVWTDPWSVELTGAVKPGKNELEIAVTNTWVNRLIGDAGQPEAKRITKTNVRFLPEPAKRSYQGFSAKDPLMTSGLIGPVRLEFDQTRFKP